jgi:hypothetical protein
VIQNPPLEVVLADFGLQLDQLVVADDAVDVVGELVVAAGFEVD